MTDLPSQLLTALSSGPKTITELVRLVRREDGDFYEKGVIHKRLRTLEVAGKVRFRTAKQAREWNKFSGKTYENVYSLTTQKEKEDLHVQTPSAS